jgi:RHS repeat-associated protein
MTKAYSFNISLIALQPDLWSTDPIWQANVASNDLTSTDTIYHYLHTDHLSTPMLATVSSGAESWKAVAETFGALDILSEGSTTMNLRFPGQYFDHETGTHYNFQRDYNPIIGRYIQSDPIGLRAGLNVFTYTEGNPLLRFDPFGLVWGVDPSGRGPEETGQNTIYCNGPEPDFYIVPVDEKCEAIKKCIVVHEQTHLKDALLEKPLLCKSNDKKIIIVNDEDSERLKSEERAFLAEISCLKQEQKICGPACLSRINSRINTLNYLLNTRVRTGNYP